MWLTDIGEPLAEQMIRLWEKTILWENNVESEIMWLQLVESMIYEDIPEVTNNAIENQDKTYWISASKSATMRDGEMESQK